MKKLLLLTNSIVEYRVPIYNMLSKIYDLTIMYFDNCCNSRQIDFKKIKINQRHIGPFIYFEENIKAIAKKYDAVLAMGDLHIIPYMLLGLNWKRNYPLVYWGGDVSFSYKKQYDQDRRFDKIRFFLMNNADSIVFYSNYPVHRYVNDGKIKPEKLFVANNTVYIPERIKIPSSKEYFLFVGTLYKEKKIFDLLNAYCQSSNISENIQPLVIVGDGNEKENIKNWIIEHKLQKKVILKGAIYNENELKNIFQNAIACISPGQAGLSVLSSMAYGVPYITSKNAITGGEIFNIENNVNGILYDGSIASLTSILIELSNNKEKTYQLSIKAQDYYYNYATAEQMIENLSKSVEYAIRIRK